MGYANTLKVAQVLDRSRIDTLWLGDSHLIWRECWTTIAALATSTESLRFASCVTNPLSRHASVIAATVATVQEVSRGRVRLGMGVGDSALRMTLGRVARLSEFERVVRLIRGLLAGETVEDAGSRYELATGAPGTDVYISGSGPKTMAMAGRLGDGTIIVPGTVPERIEHSISATEVELESRTLEGRPRTMLWIALAVDEDESAALDQARPFVSSVLRHPLSFPLSDEIVEIRERIRAGYDFTHHMAGSAGHASVVPDHIVREFAVVGTPDQVAEAIGTLSSAPVDELAFVLVGDPVAAARHLTRIVGSVPLTRSPDEVTSTV